MTTAALAAALALSGSGPILAQEIRAVSGRGETGARIGETGVPALLNVSFPLSPSAFNASLTPSPLELGARSLELRALSNPFLLPAPERGAPARAPARAVSKASVQPGSGATSRAEAEALPAEAADGDAKDFADAAFRRLGAEAGAKASGDAPAPVASPSTKSWKRRVLLAAGLAAGVGSGALQSAGAHASGSLSAAVSAGPTVADAGQVLGQAGYWTGNVLDFLLPGPDLLKAIKTGRADTSRFRAGVLVVNNLILGLVNASMIGSVLWGLQNISVAAAMLMIWPAARWSRKVAGGQAAELSRTQVLLGMSAAAVASLAAGAALYFTAAAVVPGVLTGWLGAAGVGQLTLALQIATGLANLLLFDWRSLRRGRAPQGFSPGFSLLWMIASIGFMFWAGQKVSVSGWGTPASAQFLFYLALNFVYAAASGASWWFSRRSAKAAPGRLPSP